MANFRTSEAVVTALAVLLGFANGGHADTFTNLKTGEVLHGYATGRSDATPAVVHTTEKGQISLDLAEYKVRCDPNGRNSKVVVIPLEGMIMYEIETAAAERCLAAAVDAGPLFILLEIDTPGGRVDYAQRIAAAIEQAGACRVISYIKGGEHGGAISAGVAVALACEKNYMAAGTVIGGATMMAMFEDGPVDLTKAYGTELGEKFISIWQASLASLAEKNGRPALLARAMVDKDMEVVEVAHGTGTLFIDPVDKKPADRLIRTWTQKGSLLTLTADEAVRCKIADKIIDSRQQLLRELEAADAEVIVDDSIQQAAKELSRARLKANKLMERLDLDLKQLEHPQQRGRGISLVRKVRGNLRTLMVLAKQYPDLQLDAERLRRDYNSVEAFYQQHKRTK